MQRLAPVPGHQQVGCAIGLETAEHLYDVGVLELRDGAAFGEKV